MSFLNHVRRVAALAGAALLLVSTQVSRVAAFAVQQDGFVPASSLPQTQSVSAPALVLAAYGLVWLFVVIFVFMMWRKLGALEKELGEARREFSARKGTRS
jgi:CcmD family protein